MTHRLVRYCSLTIAAAAVVAAGIALNLGILSDRHWGPGGLTLGAAGVVRTEPAAPDSTVAPNRTSTTRRTTSTQGPTSTSPVSAQPFRPSTPRSSAAPDTPPTNSGTEPVTTAAPTTVRPRSTTTSRQDVSEPQEFRIATWAKAVAEFKTPSTLKVTAIVKRGWTVDQAVKTGRDVTMKFRNGPVEVTFHAWISNGTIQSANQRIKHDS